jgi:hypothetical protein
VEVRSALTTLTLPAPVTLREFDEIFEAVKDRGRTVAGDLLVTTAARPTRGLTTRPSLLPAKPWRRAGTAAAAHRACRRAGNIGAGEPAAGLLGQVQAEAQARRVDPPAADLAQAPYSRVLRQGIGDLGQARRCLGR